MLYILEKLIPAKHGISDKRETNTADCLGTMSVLRAKSLSCLDHVAVIDRSPIRYISLLSLPELPAFMNGHCEIQFGGSVAW